MVVEYVDDEEEGYLMVTRQGIQATCVALN